jgi:hypothetical protein
LEGVAQLTPIFILFAVGFLVTSAFFACPSLLERCRCWEVGAGHKPPHLVKNLIETAFVLEICHQKSIVLPWSEAS